MKIKLDLNKRDLLTIVALSTIFFSLAVWNLGLSQAPVNSWRTTENKLFIIDLGEQRNIGKFYFLVKNGSADVQVETGSPESWNTNRSLSISASYYSWAELDVNSLTRYLRVELQPKTSIDLAEVAVLDPEDQMIKIATIMSDGDLNPNLSRLIDEQNLVQLPPTYMGETYFDEIYFVKSAEQYLDFQVPYEWTHPPLGKLIIAAGIVVLGYSPFGWRIMGVIAATLMIPMIYVLGKKLLGTWIGASTSAFLLAFDFMHFTMARMATADTYVVFFSVASQLFFLIYLKEVLKKGWNATVQPLFLAFVFFALGFSTKWVVLYGFVAQLVILILLRLREVAKVKKGWLDKLNTFSNHPYAMIIGFSLVAVFIYFLTYIPDMLAGRSLIEVINLQGSMYGYHSTLNATHAFSSPWWNWPLMLKPLWLFVSYLPDNFKSTIVLFGNPAVWWVGFMCVIGISIFTLVKIAKTAGRRLGDIGLPATFISVFFFFQWVPYVFISRVTFIYHFYVNVPFLCLASAYFISKYWSSKWVKVAAISYFAVTVAMFWLFYTVISGTPATNSWIDSLKWFGGWVF
ncbi:phospholipid carrier-dependent glycosyltransferase [Candidatus Bathyarchaeota archaeon]|nr:phospholipid carrier-dependent glycosyltransferase [Candidatus Bathyarchaeota archaeon]